MNFTNYIENQQPAITKTILTCYLRLDKNSMLQALQADSIVIHGKHYVVPERILLECLINKRYGETRLDLEEITEG